MAYTPGTLHVSRLLPDGTKPRDADSTSQDPARRRGSTVTVVPDAALIKDPSDGTTVLSGEVVVKLVGGSCSIALPPTHGMDPDPVTYAVRVHIEGYAPDEWVTGVEIVSGQVTELAAWTSTIPGSEVPNVQAQMAGLMATVDADSSSTFRSQVDARQVIRSDFDFIVTTDGSDYVAQGRTARFLAGDPAHAANLALASVPQRSAAILFALRGVHACSETILVGNSTVLAGPAGRMGSQIPGNGTDNASHANERIYAPLLLLDFTSVDDDAIANDTPGAAYRPHQWTVRDLGIKGSDNFTTRRHAGIKARYNAGGPNGGRCGIVTIHNVFVEGYLIGIDGMAAGATDAWDGGIDTFHVEGCHTHRTVIGYRGGYSDTRLINNDAWQALLDPLAQFTPAGFVIQGRGDVVAFNEVEPSLDTADGIRIDDGGTSDPGVNTSKHSRSSLVIANVFAGSGLQGIVVAGGTRHRIVNNSLTDGLLMTAKSVWLKAGVTETEVRGNTVNAAAVDDSASATNLVLDNHVAGAFRRDVATVEESLAPYRRSVGTETIPIPMAVSSASTNTGDLRLTRFVAPRTETVTIVDICSGGTPAAPTPSLTRIAAYKTEANGDLTLVASTANDTSLLAAANTKYSKALQASLTFIKGQEYWAGDLVVTAATAPTVAGAVVVPFAASPQAGCRLAGQADLPATIPAATVASNPQGHLHYIAFR